MKLEDIKSMCADKYCFTNGDCTLGHSGLGWMEQRLAQFVFANAPQEAVNGQMGWLLELYFILKCHVEINYCSQVGFFLSKLLCLVASF